MLVLLLFATRVAGEWVEISQYQRRADPTRRVSIGYSGATGPNKMYANHSLTEHPWHMSGISRVPNIGTVRRVQMQGKEKASISVGGFSENTYVKATTVEREYESIGSVRAPDKKVLKDNLETDTVKRKYPEIKISVEEGNAAVTNYIRNGSINELSSGIKLDKVTPVNIKENSKETENKGEHNPGGRLQSSDVTRSTTYKTLSEHQSTPPLHPYLSNTFKHNIQYNFDSSVDSKVKTESQQENQIRREDVNMGGDTKTNTVQVIWKLMKIVTDNISRNTRRNFRGKIRYLEDLQNNIIANIAERVEQAWPDDKGAKAWRARRRRSEAARGHVEFPSSESALMTISFLTFAVFLIKLVLQVIHTYKNKTMMVTPAVVAAVGRAAASFKQQVLP